MNSELNQFTSQRSIEFSLTLSRDVSNILGQIFYKALFMKKRVVITAMEVVSSLGTGIDKFWQNLIAGQSGITKISHFDTENYPTKIGGTIKDFSLDEYPHLNKPKRYAKATQMALYCAKKAIEQSGLTSDELEQAGTIIGTGLGGSPESEEAYRFFYEGKWRKVPALTITKGMPNSIANMIGIECGLQGKNLTISNACNSSAEAIGNAFEQIQWGKLPIALCGGSESMLWESIMSAWCKLRVMSTNNDNPEKACRPFDLNRDGMVMADGAAVLVLEELDHALARSAKPIAEIIGFGSCCDAYHITAPSVEGQVRAVELALQDGKLSANDIQHINAHGTSTKLNDETETETIKQVFGKHAYDIPVTANKSMLGHSIGAAGALEIAAVAQTLRNNIIPPTLNLETPDPACNLDYVPNVARKQNVDIALSQHFAFGGANCALILKSY